MRLSIDSALRRLRALHHSVTGAAVYWSGTARLFELAAQPSGAIIIMYHSVAPDDVAEFIDPPNRVHPAMFAKQMEFLREHRRVVPLAEVVEQVSAGHSPPAGTVCITLDDGYLDTFTIAAPILAKLGLPATLYLATGYVERRQAQWADVLHWQLRRRTADQLRVPWLTPLDLAHPPGRHAAYTVLHQHLLEADEAERAELLAEVGRQLAPTGKPPRITLGWDDVRELQRRYPLVEIGGHTRDHIDLTSNRGAAARAQIESCAADLRRELGLQPSHFSYPYSRWWEETQDLVRAAGWTSAVGMGHGVRIVAGSDVFAMPRIETPQTMTELRFKTSGAYPGALAMLDGAGRAGMLAACAGPW